MTTNAELKVLVEELAKEQKRLNDRISGALAEQMDEVKILLDDKVSGLEAKIEDIESRPDPPAPGEEGGGEIAQLQGQIDALAKVVAGKKSKKILKGDPSSVIKREDHPGEGGGWFVQSRNKSYQGITCGIQFVNGMAIVDVEVEEAEKKVHQLEHEFEYQVTALDEEELNEARRNLALGRGVFDKKEAEMSVGEKLLQPVSFQQE